MSEVKYIDLSKFNCQLYLLRLSWKSAKESTKESVLYNSDVSKITFFRVLDGEISNTEYQYNRINNWITMIYRIENFGELV